MSTNENTAPKADVYERVTSQIVNAIEQGVSNWRMPWHTSGRFAFSPINAITHKPYRGPVGPEIDPDVAGGASSRTE